MVEQLVLLVDDIPEYLDEMELHLPEQCSVVRALSAEAARDAAEQQTPELAVVDIRLEEDGENRDGLELLTWFQTHHPRTKVIMISAYEEFVFEAESLARGAELFLQKPLRPDIFREAIESVLRSSR